MKNMIKEIVETDKAARLDVERAQERHDMLQKELDEQTKTFEAKCAEEADAKINMARQQLEKGYEEALGRIEAQTLEKREQLQGEFERSHAVWEDTIYKNIIG